MIYKRNILLIVLLSFIMMMNVGGALSNQIMMEEGMMADCPYMGVAAICTMTPLQHFSEWQQMFTATAQSMTLMSVLLLLALTAALSGLFRHIAVPNTLIEFRARHRYRYRENIFDSLRLALARGIIHTKVY